MKRCFIILFALFVCMVSSADDKEAIDLTCLKGQSIINLDVDWSNLTIRDLSVDDWFAYRQALQYESDEDTIAKSAKDELEKDLKPQITKLVERINKALQSVPLALVKKEGCKYTLCIRPLAFDEKGNNKMECLVINNETEETIADFYVNGKGGHWGSLKNLWGDGFKDSGEQIGDIIQKAIEKKAFIKVQRGMINLDVDWSKLTINSLSVDEWLAYRQAKQPKKDVVEELENDLKPQIVELTKKINNKLGKISFELVERDGCKYSLRICPLTFDEEGNNILQCFVINNETKETIDDFTVKGKSGRGGSNLKNQWGEGFKDSGEKIGDILCRTIQNKIDSY